MYIYLPSFGQNAAKGRESQVGMKVKNIRHVVRTPNGSPKYRFV
jgi:hypothetical protein